MALMLSSSFKASRIASMVAFGLFCCILELTAKAAGSDANTCVLKATSEMASGVLLI